ncbi:molecular chaperone, partial [Brevibacillus sp. SYSU BS000544]|uniref:molecular chaperone n=1 Tax=Brevibacillus sp. SYSU BS000544 TaxID=3416443 RepID=UPI003CE58B36
MHTYSYKLYLDGREESGNHKFPRYTRDELTEMTTYQLRNICYIEKLVPALINTLDREALIETILKFRGAVTHQLIQENVTGGYERVEAVIKKYLRTPFPDNGSIKVPARMTLYSGLSINKRDNYRVKAENGIVESNVLIVNDSLELCGILNLIQDSTQSGHFYLSSAQSIPFRKTANRNYSYLFFRKQDSDYLYKVYTQDKPMPPANLHYYKIPATDLEIRQLEETDAILAIDFGTTNTTAGAYLDQAYISQPCDNDILNGRVRIGAINYVAFPDATQKEEDWIEILPTVVSVADASDPLHIKFHFGYDAVASTRKNGYSSHASVFHGMKRWVNSYTQMEEVMDGQGNSAMTKRSDILRSYLIYCIQMAEQQYKCRFKNLHISSPVKLKSQFIDMFTEILPEYHIETEHSLDEGMAVLYNTIADQIDKNSFLDGEEYNALVIDCGGGTTDLSSCRFRIRDGKISYQIDIQTTYENGDTNFGGNNLTYRIMQYIKIVFADYYSRVKHIRVIDDLIDIPGSEVFRHVDEQGIRSVYQQLEQSYQEAEAYLPTRYKEYENRSRDEYQRVRNNYHFLWDLAENMKKEFFRKTGMLRNRFHAESNDQRNNDLKITAVERWA